MRRRDFLTAAAGLVGTKTLGPPRRSGEGSITPHGATAGPSAAGGRQAQAIPATIRAPRLRAGDTVGVITPATATFQQVELDIVRESIEALGFTVKIGPHVMSRHGSLGGTDAERAADFNAFANDPGVRAILPTRGGWGSARLLPLLDYNALRRNPKVVLGFSDITALLNGIHARTGLVTFHGPNGGGRWDQTSLDWMKHVLFNAEVMTYANPKTMSDRNVLAQIDNRTQKINGGRARGRLVGGNLTVFTTLMGSPYVPVMNDAILFLEDTGEAYYRIDRMMTQLKLAGALDKIRGFVFGTCNECSTDGFATLTLDEIFADHIAPLKIPAWSGAMIGHAMTQWTLPVGAEVEIDADRATLMMMEPGVVAGG
jgi:muramoyltetrapeptide carboxypeptidase